MDVVKVLSVLLLLVSLPAFGKVGAASEKPEKTEFYQEKVRIEGTVTDEQRLPVIGANIIIEGATNGTVTDLEGKFTMEAPIGSVLKVSYIGYTVQTVRVEKSGALQIVLKEDAQLLDQVVVTALGLTKLESSLVYSMKQVAGEELVRVKDPNLMNALAGKVSGMQVNKVSSGLGASSKVLMRGIRSVTRNNQPLYVIDGIPISNTSNEQAYTAVGGTADAGNRDGGDGISNLNPEDVESISVLKGAPAAALYGSMAANGVILITTKTGRPDVRKITFTTNLTFDNVACLPEFQNTYGVSDGINSWGQKTDMPAYNNLSDFFKTSVTSMNNISVSAGNDRYLTYFSYGNTFASGFTENNRMQKHNFNFRETASLFNNYLKLDANVNLFRQRIGNRNPPGGFYMNPLVGLYRFPRGMDISPYKEHFEVWSKIRSVDVQNWHSDTSDFEQNPYWIVNRIQSEDVRERTLASLSLELKATNWLKFKARGSMDNVDDKIRQKFYATTAISLAGDNGRYVEMDYQETMFYGDVMGVVDKKWNKLSLNAMLGASINDNTLNSLRLDSKTASLYNANVFSVANIVMNESAQIDQVIDRRTQMQSVFATAQLGWEEKVYLDVSARNDWSSTLAYTSNLYTGYFYPSIGASWLIHQTWKLPEWVSFSKIRAAWSKVGNDLPTYVTHQMARKTAGEDVLVVDTDPKNLKPEMTTSVEVGTEWKFLSGRLGVNFTWYKTNTRNQYFLLQAPTADKHAFFGINAGNIQNKGWEVGLSANPLVENDYSWRMEFNFSSNTNKVLELHEELPVFTYGPQGFSSSYAMKLIKGGSFGDIYGKAFERDENGQIVYETTGENAGLPKVTGAGNQVKVGNINPAFTLSWSNALTYKQWALSFLIDSRYKGDILSQTLADMDQFGVTKATATARDLGYVELEGRKIENVEGFFRQIVGGRAGVTEYYMYDATNIRLREAALSYTLPRRWTEATNVFRSVQFSLVGRNLFFFYKKAPFDPELVLSTGNDNQGIEAYGMPTTRSLGFNIKCEF